MKILGIEISGWGIPKSTPAIPIISVDNLPPASAWAGQTAGANWEASIWDGGKFAGGLGPAQLFQADYWTLRLRSSQLFTENLYARGLIRRLITNEINTGLTPESCPDEDIIGVPEGSLADWTETTENRFLLWGKSPALCDWRGQSTFGALQRAARLEALVGGDVLVVLRQRPGIPIPAVQLVSGHKVRTPLVGDFRLRQGHRITHGVEQDAKGRIVAYWVEQDKGGTKRLPAFGARSGRRLAWLVYGTEKRLDDLRGMPILSLVLQSLKEIDRYRDSAQRKAVINSILAMFIKKTEEKAGTLPTTGGARRKDAATVVDGDGETRTRRFIDQIPGVVYEELQVGEEPVGFHNQGTDDRFGVFEEAIIQTVAWASEIPPEILRLAFSNNYAASQAAINEFKIYLNRVWSDWGETFCSPVWTDWLLSETLARKVKAPGLLDAWRSPAKADIFGAWAAADWYGSIKPSTDMVKQVKGSGMLLDRALSTHAREARGTTGTRWTRNVKRLARENQLLVEAQRPLAEFKKEFGEQPDDPAGAKALDDLESFVDDYLDSRGVGDGNG